MKLFNVYTSGKITFKGILNIFWYSSVCYIYIFTGPGGSSGVNSEQKCPFSKRKVEFLSFSPQFLCEFDVFNTINHKKYLSDYCTQYILEQFL